MIMENSTRDQRIDKRWQRYNTKLDKVALRDLRSALESEYIRKTIIAPVELNELIMETRVNLLLKHFGKVNNVDILEVGGGYGNFAKIFSKTVNTKSFTLLDTKSMLRFAKAFLKGENINFVNTEELERLFDKKFDIFISSICLSEVPDSYRKLLIDKIIPNCNGLYVMDTMLNDLKECVEKNFSKISIEPIEGNLVCPFKNHYLYIGKKDYGIFNK